MTLTVTYDLTPAAQRALVLAGNLVPIRSTVTLEAAPADLSRLGDRLTIQADGGIAPVCATHALSRVPADLADFLSAEADSRLEAAAQCDAALDAREAEVARYEAGGDYPSYLHTPSMVTDAQRVRLAALNARVTAEGERRQTQAAAAARKKEVAAMATRDFSAMRAERGYSSPYYSWPGTATYAKENLLTLADEARVGDAARAAIQRIAAEAEKKEAELAADDALEVVYFAVEGGLCDFSSASRRTADGEKVKGCHRRWATYDEHHWLGVFSAARGVDRFLSGPRGERIYDVSSLAVGECIQQASYSQNSRGKRRNEVERFGAVVSVAPDLIGLRRCDSRASALKFARTLA